MISLEERQASCNNPECKRVAYVTREERSRGRWTCYQCGLINLWKAPDKASIALLLQERKDREKLLKAEEKRRAQNERNRYAVAKTAKRLSYGTTPTMTTKQIANIARKAAAHARNLEHPCLGCGASIREECERAWRCDMCKAPPGEECRGEAHVRRHNRIWR